MIVKQNIKHHLLFFNMYSSTKCIASYNLNATKAKSVFIHQIFDMKSTYENDNFNLYLIVIYFGWSIFFHFTHNIIEVRVQNIQFARIDRDETRSKHTSYFAQYNTSPVVQNVTKKRLSLYGIIVRGNVANFRGKVHKSSINKGAVTFQGRTCFNKAWRTQYGNENITLKFTEVA